MRYKKIWLVFSLLILVIVGTGCQKQLTAQEGGILFVNRLIYETKDERFEKGFVHGLELDIKMAQQRKQLTADLVTSFSEFGGVISPKQTELFLEQWLNDMQKKAMYDVTHVEKIANKQQVKVTYSVRGIDFQKVYQSAIEKLVERMLADSTLLENSVKLGDLTIQLLTESLNEATITEKPINVSIRMEQVKKKWQLVAKQQEQEVANVLLVFMVGVKDLDEYAKGMSAVVSEAISQGSKKIELEFSEEVTGEEESLTRKESTRQNEAEKKAAEDRESKRQGEKLETIETLETYAEGE